MNKIITVTLIIAVALVMSAFGQRSGTDESVTKLGGSEGVTYMYIGNSLNTEVENEENAAKKISIIIGNNTFSASLYDNDTAREFLALLPMTLNMSELNGNEKYYYLPERLPAAAEQVGNIKAGDLMLYGSDCLVLFYESFSTSYGYTRLGYIDNPSGLADAVGRGNADVTFGME